MSFEELFSVSNLFDAWKKFRRGKTSRPDAIVFGRRIEDNLLELSEEILGGNYQHGGYCRFDVFDAKKREINSAKVKDRIVHQVIHDFLTSEFKQIFIEDSYSSRIGKGTELAVAKLAFFLRDEAKWNYGVCFALKCDIRKYFDSIDHQILLRIIGRKVLDGKICEIISEIVESFEFKSGKGMPLGNLTSQIFANIYLNEVDYFVKRDLRIAKYVRYNDDFVVVGCRSKKLLEIKDGLRSFTSEKLGLDLPENKIAIRKFQWGIEFLGRVILPNAVLLRKNMVKKIWQRFSEDNKASYLGLLSSTKSFWLTRRLFGNRRQDFGFFD